MRNEKAKQRHKQCHKHNFQLAYVQMSKEQAAQQALEQ